MRIAKESRKKNIIFFIASKNRFFLSGQALFCGFLNVVT